MKMKMLGFCLAAAVGVVLPSFGDTYTSEGYLQDGLVAQWDGIDNAGVGLHLPDSGVWKDLVGNCDLSLLSGKGWVPGSTRERPKVLAPRPPTGRLRYSTR